MNKIRKGDEVILIAGKDRGRRGRVSQVLGEKIVVENINLVKRHVKPNPQRGVAGGIVEKEAPVHISNVAIFNTATGKADRVGVKTLEDQRKVRFFKGTKELIDA
jgi:large subunit ribosomal protein L24